jgi:hypothetical protein
MKKGQIRDEKMCGSGIRNKTFRIATRVQKVEIDCVADLKLNHMAAVRTAKKIIEHEQGKGEWSEPHNFFLTGAVA